VRALLLAVVVLGLASSPASAATVSLDEVVLPATVQGDVVGTLVAQEAGDTGVAAYDGWLVWSRYDPNTSQWSLIGRAPDTSSAAPLGVPSRPAPFDLDLGPDEHGRPAAVYSRCRREPRSFGPYLPISGHRDGRGCRIVKLDLTTHRETTVLRRTGSSLIYPTLWRTRLAYVAIPGHNENLRIEERIARGKTSSVRDLGRGPAPDTEAPEAGPLRLDLYGQNLVYAWQTSVGRCRGPVGDDQRGPYLVSRVYLQRDTGRRVLLDKGCDLDLRIGAVIRADAAAISSGGVYWVRARRSSSVNGASAELRRRPLRGGATRQTPIPESYGTIAADGGTVYAQTGSFAIVRLMPN
jgi:hypothetical protein